METQQAREELISFLRTISRAGQSVDGAGDDTNLIDAGIIDSLAVVQIILHLEQKHLIDLRHSGIDPSELVSISGILRTIGNVNR